MALVTARARTRPARICGTLVMSTSIHAGDVAGDHVGHRGAEPL
jgi:hypothetical protein